jgi:hypothetical protein
MIWRILWPLLLAAALALISANFLFGLPGAFFIDLVLPQEAVVKMGPGGWAAAVYVSMLAPFGVAPTMWAMSAWRPAAAWWQWALAGLASYLAAGVVATLNIA